MAKRNISKICSVENCDREVIARGFCGKHYQQKKSSGELRNLVPGERRSAAQIDKHCATCGSKFIARSNSDTYCSIQCSFWGKVTKSLHCWEWNSGLNADGYGRFEYYINRTKNFAFAHRFSYELHNGVFDTDLCVLHKCDNRKCVNPDHLFLGTRKDNNLDRDVKGRHVSLTGANHPRAKLTAKQVLFAFESKDTLSSNDCGRLLGVSGALIRDIRLGRSWKHLGLLNGQYK